MNAAPPVFTLTGNLLAERTLDFSRWSPGRTQRATAESFQVGGKGINVSKMLTRLGAPNTALCFTGGASGTECEAWLRARGVAFRAFPTGVPTRTGTVVRDGSGVHAETTFLAADAPAGPLAVRACAEFLDAQPDGAVLAVCGSIPGWDCADFDPLRATLERWLRRATLVADTYGPPLAWLAARPLSLVKLNADEFRPLFTAEDTPAALRRALTESAVAAWIVTDGPRDVWFAERGAEPARLSPPPVKEVSATGSGDVLFASVLHARLQQGVDLRSAVAFAMPLAAANAAHAAIAEFPFPPRDVD